MFKNKLKGLQLIAAGSLLAFSAHATAPTEIIFSNHTDLALDTAVAGLPGNGIDPNVTKPVSYAIVTIGCNFANALTNCPIEFYNRANGDHVATVRINALEAALVEAPTFYGAYGDKYEVSGWEATPISAITIQSKA